MKAKEYAEAFCRTKEELGIEFAVRDLVRGFCNETAGMIRSRRVGTGFGLFGVLNEMDMKWRALERLAPELRPDGYEELIRVSAPKLYADWMESRKRIRNHTERKL